MTSPFPDRHDARRDISLGTFVVGVGFVTLYGLWLRLHGLSRGSLYRDDAWVALTHRVPWSEAWHMVGTAPGFVLAEKVWVTLTAPSTWWAQVPTLLVSLVGIVMIALVTLWWGYSRRAALVVALLISISPVAVTYATHLKPYAHDIFATTIILASAEWWRRGHSAWPWSFLTLACLATAFDTLPLVVGVGLAMVVLAFRHHSVHRLIAPGLGLVLPFGALYLAVRRGISPRLRESWAPNFIHWSSLHALAHSVWTVTSGLVSGFVDTTPHAHLPVYAKGLVVVVVILAVVGAVDYHRNLFALAGVAGAVLGAAIHLVPLGTGRTDAYLYPALAILVVGGISTTTAALRQHSVTLSRVAIAAVLAVVTVGALDLGAHRPTYPGGSIDSVARAATRELRAGGGVLVEGTARWPWTYYEVRDVRLVFSNQYNTGFAPLSDNPNVEIMPGTTIEGGYNPVRAVAAMRSHDRVLYVRTDDWPALGDPLQRAFSAACFHPVRALHTPGFYLEWLVRGCSA